MKGAHKQDHTSWRYMNTHNLKSKTLWICHCTRRIVRNHHLSRTYLQARSTYWPCQTYRRCHHNTKQLHHPTRIRSTSCRAYGCFFFYLCYAATRWPIVPSPFLSWVQDGFAARTSERHRRTKKVGKPIWVIANLTTIKMCEVSSTFSLFAWFFSIEQRTNRVFCKK
jgi:hypothetical protein